MIASSSVKTTVLDVSIVRAEDPLVAIKVFLCFKYCEECYLLKFIFCHNNYNIQLQQENRKREFLENPLLKLKAQRILREDYEKEFEKKKHKKKKEKKSERSASSSPKSKKSSKHKKVNFNYSYVIFYY